MLQVSFDNGVSFSCHKLVLAAFSTYLETLLQSTETCAFLGMDQLEPIYVRQMRYIFDYMYGVSVKLDDKQVCFKYSLKDIDIKWIKYENI